ncbi:MAG: hypothetical protein HYW91_01680 [Candidatus Sungbacteria bacterium]|nr:hypothetical protein [Candidatus Sungbacteria bacterium]
MVLFVSALFIVGAAGCATVSTDQQGGLFLPYDLDKEDFEAGLRALMDLETELTAKIGVWNLFDVDNHILTSSKVAREKGSYPDLLPDRHATITAQNKVVTHTFRFAVISTKTLSIPVKSWRKGTSMGLSLSATAHNNKLVEVKTGFTTLPTRSTSYSSKDAVLMLGGGVAVLFLLP